MGKVIAYLGNTIGPKSDTTIGAFEFPDRKRPTLGVRKGNVITVYGTFNNKKAADMFMDELSVLLNIPKMNADKEAEGCNVKE